MPSIRAIAHPSVVPFSMDAKDVVVVVAPVEVVALCGTGVSADVAPDILAIGRYICWR